LTSIEWVIGSSFDDRISGNSESKILDGGLGNDTISGVNATVLGGDGDDSLSGQNVDGGAGNDRLTGTFENGMLSGGEGDDQLTSTTGNDTLIGGEGDDTLTQGFSGGDVFDGSEGTDTFKSPYTVQLDLSIVGPQDTGRGLVTLTNIENLSASGVLI